MRAHSLMLLVLVGCYSPSATRLLPIDHPANPDGAVTPYDPGPSPFVATPTFSPPMAGAQGSMTGMGHGSGMSGMDMGAEKGSDAAAKYSCPMHPDVIRDKPEACPVCGMTLRPMQSHTHGDEDSKR